MGYGDDWPTSGNVILNLGCGKHPIPDMVNIDGQIGEGVDLVLDLDAKGLHLPYDTSTVDGSVGNHVIEHLRRPLGLMQELWRVTKPGGFAQLACPYGSSDDAWENPDHERPYFVKSWGFFGQPNYWREDSYGYTADWRVMEVELRVRRDIWDRWFAGADLTTMMGLVNERRNMVSEMVATLECVKPVRKPLRELQEPLPVRFSVLIAETPWTNRVVRAEEYERGMGVEG